MLHKKYVMLLSLLTVTVALSQPASGSGAFSPSGGGPNGKLFNHGKAIISGRVAGEGCKSCHASFKRAKLKKLSSKISLWISNCNVHNPCFSATLSKKQLAAVDTYMARRYKLK